MSKKHMLGVSARETKGVIADLHEKLGGPHGKEWLAATKRFLRKEDPWKEHLIDCSVQPTIPKGWRIEPEDQIASRFQGELVWSPEKIRLHLDEAQKKGIIVGNDLKKKLEGKLVLPANVLDYLLQHPALIPPDWKGKAVFFWGTVYRHSDGYACVRYLRWGGRRWLWYVRWLGFGWDGSNPSAVLAG